MRDDRAVDPIEFELIHSGLSSIVDDMALTIVRTAYSNVVRDNMDFSTALCDRHGALIAQGLTIPLHLGSVPDAMASFIGEFGNDIADGDVWVMNDPFSGGMHLPDVFVVKPIVAPDGDVCGFAVTIAHQTDVGGRVAEGTPQTRPRFTKKVCGSRRFACTGEESRTKRSSSSFSRMCASPTK